MCETFKVMFVRIMNQTEIALLRIPEFAELLCALAHVSVRLVKGCIAWLTLTTTATDELSAYEKKIKGNLTITSNKLILVCGTC